MEKEVSPVAMVKSLNHVLSTRRLVSKSPTLPFGPIIVLGALDYLCNIQGNLPPPSARVTSAVLGQTSSRHKAGLTERWFGCHGACLACTGPWLHSRHHCSG